MALAIAGSDSGANAGAQADLLSFAANGVYGTTALTCITAQNPTGVAEIEALSPHIVGAQIKQVVDYYHPRAIKTGMLFNDAIIEIVAASLQALPPRTKIVIDPVLIASSGSSLLEPSAIERLQGSLLPLADLITPNLDEAEALVGSSLESQVQIEAAARKLADRYETAILIKGGHLPGNQLIDTLCFPAGELVTYEQTRIAGIDTHGSGCTLSSAIAAWLAQGASIEQAVSEGRRYLRKAMENPLKIKGKAFINHSP